MSFIRCILKWVRELTTSRNNQTPDVIRISTILLLAQFSINSGYDLFGLGNPFEPTDFGTGAGLILAAAGAALLMKQKDEPDA